jgi:hypothetical protein
VNTYRVLKKLVPSHEYISPIATFNEETIFFDNHRFINAYWIELDKTLAKFKLLFEDKLLPLRAFEKDSNKAIGGINMGSIYLTDENVSPLVYYYNLAIDNGKIKQLPSNSRSLIVTTNGVLKNELVRATGSVSIGNIQYTWSGSNENTKSQLVVYGMFDLNILKDTNGKRILDISSKYVIPNSDELLLGIKTTSKDTKIVKISNSKLNITKYNFILKGKKIDLRNIKVDDILTDFTLNSSRIDLRSSACSSSFSLGRNRKELDNNLYNELIYPRNGKPRPMFQDYKKSWSVVLETEKSVIFFINDARPKIVNQNGITVYELQELLLKKFNYHWAVVGDSGQSSKLFINNKDKRKVYGNLHYINYLKKYPYWDGLNGRPIGVALIAYA